MNIDIPVVLICPSDKKYVLNRGDFEFVRALLLSIRTPDTDETNRRLGKLLRSSLKFKNKEAFKLKLDTAHIDTENIKFKSTNGELSDWDMHYMGNLVKCVLSQKNSILILPAYIKICGVDPKKKKTRRTRKTRNEKQGK
jgi:hypothetical protein